MALSEGVPDSDLQKRLDVQAPNTACTLIYTVGSLLETRKYAYLLLGSCQYELVLKGTGIIVGLKTERSVWHRGISFQLSKVHYLQ